MKTEIKDCGCDCPCKDCECSCWVQRKEILKMIDEFEEQMIKNLGWTQAEHSHLRSQLGIKFDILKKQIKGEEK